MAAAVVRTAFPRSNERGSIEACSQRRRGNMRRRGFHVRMNVAQLKQVSPADFSVRHHVFPRSNERGSIEAFCTIIQLPFLRPVSTFE